MVRKKRKTFAWQPNNEFLYNLMASKIGVLVINWVFQGMLGMDRFELWFKISLDIIFTFIFLPIILNIFTIWPSIIISFLFAHTINWLFNGHLFVVGRFVGFTYNPPSRIIKYMKSIKTRVNNIKCLQGVLIFGNVTRGGGISYTSDIDIRFIRKKGFWNGLCANLIGLKERTIALFSKFPLDLYIYDDIKSLDRLRKDEKPIILYDPQGKLKEKYKERGYTFL